MILYKYRTDSENTENILKEKKVWFAKPETLNDPLECSIQEISETLISKYCEEEKLEQLQGFVMAYIMTPTGRTMWGLSKDNIKKVLDRIGQEKELNDKYRIYADFIKSRTGNYPSDPMAKYLFINDILNMVGIFSMSETCENELMWGHYSDGGKGIAIGFEIEDGKGLTIDSMCLKVKYVDDPIVLNQRIKPTLVFYLDQNQKPVFFQASAFDDPFLRAVMSTKNTIWNYEKEWRYVEQIFGLKNIIAPVKEIVFGPKCPQSVREKYISLVKQYCNNSVLFFEIVIKGRHYIKQTLHQ